MNALPRIARAGLLVLCLLSASVAACLAAPEPAVVVAVTAVAADTTPPSPLVELRDSYDKAWHLPAPPSFRVIAPAGPVPPSVC